MSRPFVQRAALCARRCNDSTERRCASYWAAMPPALTPVLTRVAAVGAAPVAAPRRKAAESARDLVPDAQQEAARTRHAVPAERDLANEIRHVPDAAGASRKEHHVAGAETMRLAFFVGDEHFAGDDVKGFIDRVMPVEPAGSARPRHGGRRAVGALREPARTRLRRAGDDPMRRNGIVKQVRCRREKQR